LIGFAVSRYIKAVKQTLFLIFILVTLLESLHAINLESYDLTDSQKELMRRFEKRGYDDVKLHKFAAIFERANQSTSEDQYIPPYKKEDLEALRQWAKGDNFYFYKDIVGISFDKKRYIKDCPNWALFGFLKASGTEFISFDVMTGNINMKFTLAYAFKNEDEDTFKETFFRLAEKNGFLKYMTLESDRGE